MEPTRQQERNKRAARRARKAADTETRDERSAADRERRSKRKGVPA
jgi:hypothetical protein